MLVDKLVAESSDAISFLRHVVGLPLADLIQLGGHSAPRTHRLSTHAPIGFTLVKGLQQMLQTMRGIRVEINAVVVDIRFEDLNGERIARGVTYINSAGERIELDADAVIIASGGMAFDQSEDGLLATYSPQNRGLATSSGPQADGAGMKLAQKMGAELVHMEHVQIHPTGFIDPKDPSLISKILGPEALRGSGGILVNRLGKRFVNELGTRGYVTNKIRTDGDNYPTALSSGRDQKSAMIVLNEEAVSIFDKSVFNFYASRGIMREYSNSTTMCAAEGLPLEAFQSTLREYTAAAFAGQDEFGKKTFPVRAFSESEMIWVGHITPVIHYTMGGIKIDNTTAVLRRNPAGDGEYQAIAGLYAAGEVTGGVHGADRLGGNSLLECVVYGRTAGTKAVNDVKLRRMLTTGPDDEL